MASLTVLTPTYNRAYTLPQCYESLCAQSCYDFNWLIIDDGSIDETRKVIEGFRNNNSQFEINYQYKQNEGKHTALNYAHPYIHSELVLILDSDDYLTKDAIEMIFKYWENYKSNKNICGMSFLRGFSESCPIGENFPDEEICSNHVDYRINKKLYGDKAEVIRTKVLKEFPFPIYNDEKYFGPGYLFFKAGFKYDTVYINKIIYVCNYLEGGLTKSGRNIRVKSPLGGMEVSKLYFDRRVHISVRIKKYWLYICYAYFARKNIKYMCKDSKHPFAILTNLPFGTALYWMWRYKFQK